MWSSKQACLDFMFCLASLMGCDLDWLAKEALSSRLWFLVGVFHHNSTEMRTDSFERRTGDKRDGVR